MPDVRPFLVYEIQTLIAEGYTNFITYFRPSLNHCVIEILNDLKKSSEKKIYVELVLISIAYLHWISAREQKEFYKLAEMCNKVIYIDERHTPQTLPAFCNYLTSRCDLLYSAGDEFRGIFGRKNKRIIEAFQAHNQTIKIVKTGDLYINPLEAQNL